MGLFRFIKRLFTPTRPEVVKTIDPERLHQDPKDKAYSKNYDKYHKTYYYGQSGATELAKAQKEFRKRGKRVKHWRLVMSHSDFSFDEYIPIFYKKRRRQHKRRR